MKIFKDLNIGDVFEFNGNKYVKQSTRTAKPLFDCHVSYYYFSLSDNVKVWND